MNRQGFTLIELLIVIGILAVLATATTLILNPAEFLAQGRDARRITDIDNLNRIMGVFNSQSGSNMAASNIVYISLPDNGVDNNSNGIANDLSLIHI